MAQSHLWVLEFERQSAPSIEPLMGYTSSDDTQTQVRMKFPTKEEAIAAAERMGVAYRVAEPHERKRFTISYSDNFSRTRRQPWTH
ncbi:ETC complex I subunit conserved region [Faunimonas pinastri]|uniref:ETC complex I subunit conserved region n=2 Tax=Faunimonas pinastri TaxID=1855383 RepID=A0A1H9L7V9_9HYPH|nr:ETC complex I subunit conserved region [Faunimonas pinastri]